MDDSFVIHVARKFITMDDARPEATAVASLGGRIVAVGSLESVLAAVGDGEVRIDETFADRIVVAGLIDEHLHPFLGALSLATAMIAPERWDLPHRIFPSAETPDQYWARLEFEAGALSDPTEFLMTWGYHQLWHGPLTRSMLDGVSSTRPIVVWHRSCHEFFLNGAAIDVLELNEQAMSHQGRASEMMDWQAGHWWEAGINLIIVQILQAYFTPSRVRQGLQHLVSYLHRSGITALNEPGVLPGEPWDLYQEVLGAPSTPFLSTFYVDARTQADSGLDPADALADARAKVAQADSGKVRMVDGAIKLFADGAIVSQKMQMREPYLDRDGHPDPDHHGEWMMEPEIFSRFAKVYWEAGWQMTIHVNGDAGLDMVLDVIERCMQAHPRPDHRTVITHFACSTDSQVDRIARLGAIVSANPYYPVQFADKFGESGLGRDRADNMVRARALLRCGIPLSYHSDFPVAPAGPLKLASWGVNRFTPSGRVAGPDQRISVHDALRAVTIEAAYAWRMEAQIGSIAPGKRANFTVLDGDPYAVDPSDLDTIGVAGVVYEGAWYPVEGSPQQGAKSADSALVLLPTLQTALSPGRLHAGCACTAARIVSRAMEQVAALDGAA